MGVVLLKKLLIGVLIFIVAIGLGGAWLLNAKETTVVYEDDQYTVSLRSPSILKFEFSKERQYGIENTIDVVQEFDITLFGMHAGTYSIVERTLGNGTVFLFERT